MMVMMIRLHLVVVVVVVERAFVWLAVDGFCAPTKHSVVWIEAVDGVFFVSLLLSLHSVEQSDHLECDWSTKKRMNLE